MVGVEAALIALQTISDDDTFLVEIIERRPILRRGRATGEGDVVICRDTGAQDRILPVRIHGSKTRERRGRQPASRDLLLDVSAVLVASCQLEFLGRR